MKSDTIDELTQEIAKLDTRPITKKEFAQMLEPRHKIEETKILTSGYVDPVCVASFLKELKPIEIELVSGLSINACVKGNFSAERSQLYLIPLLMKLKINFNDKRDLEDKVIDIKLNNKNKESSNNHQIDTDKKAALQDKTIKFRNTKRIDDINLKGKASKKALYKQQLENSNFLENATSVSAIILVSKKNSATNIDCLLKKLNPRLKTALAAGGTNIGENIKNIKDGVDVVLGTTGRLCSLIENKIVTSQHIIIEEADLLLLPDTVEKFNKICHFLNAKSTWLFAEKFNTSLRLFIENLLPNYKFINLLHDPLSLKHYYVVVEKKYKFLCLKALLERNPSKKFLIFCNAPTVKILTQKLQNSISIDLETKSVEGYRYVILSENSYTNFDFKDFKCVINFDVPFYAELYFCRLRKFGRIDYCVNIYCEGEFGMRLEVEKRLGRDMNVVIDGCFDGNEKI